MKSFSVQMKNLLNEFNADLKEVVDEAAKDTGKEAVNTLKATSPQNENGSRSGRYARGWRSKREGDAIIVYNATDGQLTHLLEKGHAVVNRFGNTGKRTSAIEHIAPVEQWVQEEFPLRIERGLK